VDVTGDLDGELVIAGPDAVAENLGGTEVGGGVLGDKEKENRETGSWDNVQETGVNGEVTGSRNELGLAGTLDEPGGELAEAGEAKEETVGLVGVIGLLLDGTNDGVEGEGGSTGELVKGLGTNTGNGLLGGDGRALTETEEGEVEVNLTVGNRDDVGGDVGGKVVVEGLDDWEAHQGTEESNTSEVTGTLKETGMQVENVRWVGFTTSWLAEEKTKLAVSDSVLRKVVVGGLVETTRVTVNLRNSGSGKVSGVLGTHGVGDWSEEEGGVVTRSTALQHLQKANGGRATGTNEGYNREKLAKGDDSGVADVRRNGGAKPDGGLTGLTVTNDELTLSVGNWEEDVDDTKAGNDGWGLT